MSRLEEVEATWDHWGCVKNSTEVCGLALEQARTLAAEVDELRGKMDDVRMGIGCARGQRTTQYCAEAAQRDEVITKLLAMLKPDDHESKCNCDECRLRRETYARACEIAGRTE